jgi:biopolymer transport protein ExbB
MADLKTPATTPVNSTTSVQAKKSSNIISLLAPIICVVAGYIIWRFVIGANSNFTTPDPNGGFWPNQLGPKGDLARMYEGGIIVPILIGCFLIVFTFVIERALTVSKAAGKSSNAEFIRKVQFYLADKKIDAAIA